MTNLTEQYRKGELPSGWYYIETDTEYKRIDCYSADDERFTYHPHNRVVSILAEVPTYDEWQTAKKMIAQSIGVCDENTKLEKDFFAYKKMLDEANKDLNKYYLENTKLKELLKRIRKELNDCPTCVEGSWKAKLVDDIDQVLQENK